MSELWDTHLFSVGSNWAFCRSLALGDTHPFHQLVGVPEPPESKRVEEIVATLDGEQSQLGPYATMR